MSTSGTQPGCSRDCHISVIRQARAFRPIPDSVFLPSVHTLYQGWPLGLRRKWVLYWVMIGAIGQGVSPTPIPIVMQFSVQSKSAIDEVVKTVKR